MSINHRELGHFSPKQRSAMLKTYKHICPLCGHQATEIDHLFPLEFADMAKIFGVDLHSENNGWVLCGKCHSKKTKSEYWAFRDGSECSKVYNKYWKLAFTPSGSRRFWKGEMIRKGMIARRNRILKRNRNRVKAQKAA